MFKVMMYLTPGFVPNIHHMVTCIAWKEVKLFFLSNFQFQPLWDIVVQTLCASGTRLDLKQAIQAASEQQPIKTTDECKAQIAEFIARRLEQFLVDSGLGVEVARAILNERVLDPVLVQQSAKDLQVFTIIFRDPACGAQCECWSVN